MLSHIYGKSETSMTFQTEPPSPAAHWIPGPPLPVKHLWLWGAPPPFHGNLVHSKWAPDPRARSIRASIQTPYQWLVRGNQLRVFRIFGRINPVFPPGLLAARAMEAWCFWKGLGWECSSPVEGQRGPSLVVPVLRLCTLNAGSLGCDPTGHN